MNIEKTKAPSGLSEPFGTRCPAKIFELIISFLHSESPTILRRLVATLTRKIIINSVDLPIDVKAGSFNLRCQFTDNYSEKKYVFTPWRYDVGERLELINALPKDGVFIDIGANVGLYTLVAAEVMGDNGRILAFEPGSLTLQRLIINLEANHKNNGRPGIQVLNFGVADENGERVLQIDEENLGASSIAKPDQSTIKEKIHCRLLLDVLHEQNIIRVDALKIDIEGAEDTALVPFFNEADDSLLPKLIIIENSDDKWSHDLFGLLSDKGYRRVLKTRLNSVLKIAS